MAGLLRLALLLGLLVLLFLAFKLVQRLRRRRAVAPALSDVAAPAEPPATEPPATEPPSIEPPAGPAA